MPKHDDGGWAFPATWEEMDRNDFPETFIRSGMSLLDWFAGQALAGRLADNEMCGTPTAYAAMAYTDATAMLAEKRRRESGKS
jgi:hypothetical protein